MTANQCRRPNLEIPYINESFSLCSFRSDADLGDNRLLEVISQCCTTSISRQFCWNYCAVDESQFPAWIGCIDKIEKSTWGTACQRTDGSIFTIGTKSSTSSSTRTPTASSVKSTTSPTLLPSSTSEPSSIPTYDASVGASATPTLLSPTIGNNGSNNGSNTTGLPPFVQAGSPKTLLLSTGGMICALLVLSTIAL